MSILSFVMLGPVYLRTVPVGGALFRGGTNAVEAQSFRVKDAAQFSELDRVKGAERPRRGRAEWQGVAGW